MKGYLKYLIENIKSGNYTTGILMIATLIIFVTILFIGSIFQNKHISLTALLWLIVGAGITISWNNYWYYKNKK